MKVTLISHASVVIESYGRRVWTDPWLFGKVFNQSWSLLPPPAFDPAMLDSIDYLWISHLHPDHFHIPSLASLPDSFKRRVMVLYQDNNPEKIFGPLRNAGYRSFKTLRHRVLSPISDSSAIYCYRSGTLDSCLGIAEPEGALFNINDAQLD
jgi:UDP-MurNAc hydroxylase